MKIIELSVLEIHNENELNEAEKLSKGKEYKSTESNSYNNLWTERNDYVSPGLSEDGVIALLYTCTFKHSQYFDKNKLLEAIQEFFDTEFVKDKNILSIKYINAEDDETQEELNVEEMQDFCYVLAYPLNGRVLSPEKWVQKGKLLPGAEIRFSDTIKEKFGLLREKKEKKEIKKYISKIERTREDEVELIYDTISKEKSVQTDMAYDAIRKRFDTTYQYFTGVKRRYYKKAQQGLVDKREFLNEVDKYLIDNFNDMSERDRDYIIKKMHSAVFEYYVLETLINDDSISDIKVLAPNKIRVKVNGGRYTSNLHFVDLTDYLNFIEGITVRNQIDIKENALNPFTDKTSNAKFILRFNIATTHVNSTPWPYLHIRKIRKDKYTMEDLIKYEMLDSDLADYLIGQAKNSKGIIFTGKGASGKTTLMNVLLDYIPYSKSGLIIQESEELFSDYHPDLMFQHVVTNPKYGEVYTLQDLARNGLLTDLDYFIIGEIKGGEAMYFLNAAATGHQCWCSVHSPSSTDAIDKLADYVMYESKYNKDESLYMLKELQTIVFIKNFKVWEISEIVGWDNQNKQLIYKNIYRRETEAS